MHFRKHKTSVGCLFCRTVCSKIYPEPINQMLPYIIYREKKSWWTSSTTKFVRSWCCKVAKLSGKYYRWQKPRMRAWGNVIDLRLFIWPVYISNIHLSHHDINTSVPNAIYKMTCFLWKLTLFYYTISMFHYVQCQKAFLHLYGQTDINS